MSNYEKERYQKYHNEGEKAASEGKSSFWSSPWANPFETHEQHDKDREAFKKGFDNTLKQKGKGGLF
tara:strand:- start:137 stop:337 length:201 start_codon:yes stop_codon:yes gene_type:complete